MAVAPSLYPVISYTFIAHTSSQQESHSKLATWFIVTITHTFTETFADNSLFFFLLSTSPFIPTFWPLSSVSSLRMSKVNKEGAQQTSLLDVLKKKMRQAREEAEAAKDEADEVKRQLEEERKKREDV